MEQMFKPATKQQLLTKELEKLKTLEKEIDIITIVDDYFLTAQVKYAELKLTQCRLILDIIKFRCSIIKEN